MRPYAAPYIAALVLAATFVPARAQDAAPRPDLDYGHRTVGFTVIEALDSTRAFRPLRDWRGQLAEETARPIQLSLWYPAEAGTGGDRMRAGDFRLLGETELDFDAVIPEAEAARLRADFVETVVGFGQDPAEAARTWDALTPAVRDAAPLPGPHPTVLYFGAAGVSDPLLPAYLASHGFVVASIPSNGRMTEASLAFSPSELTIDTRIDDGGFVHGLLRRLPYADTRRLAVASFSGVSLAALLWTMRDMQPAAIVSLEGWERYRRGADIITQSVHYDPHRVRVPYLLIERAPDETSPAYAKVPDVVGAMPYADITRVAFRDASHGDFLSHASFGHTPHHARIYEASARMVRQFLQAALQGDEDAARALAHLAPPPDDPFFAVTRDPAVEPAPTEEELFRLAETDPAAALAAYRQVAARMTGLRLFRESVLTRAALFASTPADRATIMEMVVDAYPASTSARWRLGDALVETGRTAAGVAALRAALERLESDPSLDEEGREQWRERLRQSIEAAGDG